MATALVSLISGRPVRADVSKKIPVEDQSVSLKKLEEFDRRKYGSTLLLFYHRLSATSQLPEY